MSTVAAVDATQYTPPSPATSTVSGHKSYTKLRLMCSYGGQIVSRPNVKSLFYAGGETRIVTVPVAHDGSLTLASLVSHLAVNLKVQCPFTLKYQLPQHDLDALISLAGDDDLNIMLDEHGRLSSSSAPSRIRLFLFPVKSQTRPDSVQNESSPSAENQKPFKAELTASPVLQNPRTEAWFVDALRSARIMQKSGLEGQNDANSGSSGDVGGGGGFRQESIVLETSSSFGSTSSSASSSNLPATKAYYDESDCNLQDNRSKFAPAESVASMTSPSTYSQTGAYQEQIISVPVMENKVASNPIGIETNVPDILSRTQMNNPLMVSGYPVSQLEDHPQGQQVQMIRTGQHYVTQNSQGVLTSGTAYYPMYHTMAQQQFPIHYQQTQSYPVYYLPVGQNQQPYNVAMQQGLNISNPQVEVRSASHVPETASQVYQTGPTPVPLVHQQQSVGVQQIHHQPQTVSIAPWETVTQEIKPEDDLVRAQIYKSQPPPPPIPSPYQASATTQTPVMLTEAMEQLRVDNAQYS